jgi:phage terminase small subunit
MKRGRQSIAELSVVPIESARKRVEPPSDLDPKTEKLFRELVEACHVDHFVKSDIPLIVSYASATLMSHRLFKAAQKNGNEDAIKAWERVCRTQTMLARALRLAPQSRDNPKTVARRFRDNVPSARELWED